MEEFNAAAAEKPEITLNDLSAKVEEFVAFAFEGMRPAEGFSHEYYKDDDAIRASLRENYTDIMMERFTLIPA